MDRIVIVGSGNIASGLAHGLLDNGIKPVQVFARNTREGSILATQCGCPFTDDPARIAEADFYILCITDTAIRTVAEQLPRNGIIVHTAASVSLDELPSESRRGVLYPLQTFTKGRHIDLRNVPVFIEGDSADTLAAIQNLALMVSDHVYPADLGQRSKLHIAAVFASNFTNYMYIVGKELAAEAEMDFSVLKPLIEETAAKALASGDPVCTQTGPAARNDFRTKAYHCDLLFEKPDLKNIYINISNKIWETLKKTSPK